MVKYAILTNMYIFTDKLGLLAPATQFQTDSVKNRFTPQFPLIFYYFIDSFF